MAREALLVLCAGAVRVQQQGLLVCTRLNGNLRTIRPANNKSQQTVTKVAGVGNLGISMT